MAVHLSLGTRLARPRAAEAREQAQPRAEDEATGLAGAFAQRYQQLLPRVYGYFLSRCPSPEEAADLAQQVFLQALAAQGRYREGDVPFEAWLFRIARNLAVDAQRRRRVNLAWEFLPEVAQGTDDGDPETAALRHDAVARLRPLLCQLDAGKRELLGYTISGPEGVTVRSYGGFVRSSLTDGQGHPLPSLGGEGSAMDAGVQGMLTASDTAGADTPVGVLTLHWHADALRVDEQSGPPAPSGQSPLKGLARLAQPLERLRAPRVTVAMAQPGPAPGEVVVPGPFDFVVSVPVVAGHVANLQQTISAAGIPVTL